MDMPGGRSVEGGRSGGLKELVFDVPAILGGHANL